MGVLESINLGISGDYGEAIYPAIGNWPTKYHSHPGFWCGDDLAAADFRRAISELYQSDISSLNRAWKSHYHSFEEVAPFLPQDAPSKRAGLEFLGWYRDSMTSYAEFWLATARDLFPNTEIYLCTGGDMAPEHGSDFSAQAKLAAKYGAGIRITNESSSFPHNFRLTRLVDSACRFYGAYFGHEPASSVTPVGYLGRIFNAVTSGARQLFYYSTPKLASLKGEDPVMGEGGRFQVSYRALETIRKPVVEVALLYPTSSSTHALRSVGTFGDVAAEIRRLVDFDFCDERMVQEGALKDKLILIVIGADILESQTLAKIQTWVSDGGLLFVLDCRPADWDGHTTITDGLEGFTSGSEEVHGISELAVREPKRLPLIAALQAIFVNRAFTGLAPDIEPLLAMQFAPEGSVAWSRAQGGGKVYAYFGPMDLKKKEDSWMESYQLPLLFLKDSLQDSLNEGRLKKMPPSLISNLQEVYLVETMDGLFALNMSPVTQKVSYPGGSFEIGAESIKVIENKR